MVPFDYFADRNRYCPGGRASELKALVTSFACDLAAVPESSLQFLINQFADGTNIVKAVMIMD